MIFSPTHIELDPIDSYYLPKLGSHAGYGQMTDMYWGLEPHFTVAVDREFDAFEAARENGLTLEEAFADERISMSESTLLAGKLVSLHTALINYVDVH